MLRGRRVAQLQRNAREDEPRLEMSRLLLDQLAQLDAGGAGVALRKRFLRLLQARLGRDESIAAGKAEHPAQREEWKDPTGVLQG